MVGTGQTPEGAEKRKIINQIKFDLDNEIPETPHAENTDIDIVTPDITMDVEQLRKRVESMDSPEFWL
jgi:tetratricopeptide (TPR) repeat protein